MSKRRNSSSRNTDKAENEQIESEQNDIDQQAEELVDDVIEAQDQQDIDEKADEISEKIVDEIDESRDEIGEEQEEIEEMNQETEQDQGFDQEPAPVVTNSSGGSGKASAAMAMSLLALAGTGYNWYDAKSSKATGSGNSSEQAAVDYSTQIQTLEQQIQSLTESQDKLAAMSASTGSTVVESDTALAEPDVVETAAESDAVEEATTEETQVVAQDGDAEQTDVTQDVAEQSVDTTESESQEVNEAVSGTTEEQAADDETVVEQEPTEEAELAASEEVQDTQTGQASSEDTMAVAAGPSSNEIKQIAMQEVDAVLAQAKKRLGLNEVAQLLSIGEQRLALAGDVTGARAALGIANERLSAFSDPLIDPVRESVAGNLESLNAVEVVDKTALTQELGNLAGVIDSLAFKPLETLADEPAAQAVDQASEEAVEEEAAAGNDSDNALSLEGAGNLFKAWGSKLGDTIGDVGSGIAGDLKDMVRIKKTGPLSDVVLAPEQEYFIRENMKLMLGGAQRAVLQNNVGVYQQNIEQAQSLLGEFFDAENEDVQSVAGRLGDLAQINLQPEVPDISNSSASLSDVLKQLASADSNSN